VRWALALKGIAYRSHAVDLLKGEQSDAAFVGDKSPMGLVPCLELDGRALTESMAILELLEEMHPQPPLLPKVPWRRARVRQLAELINSGTQPLQNLAVLRHRSSDPAEQKAWARHWITRGFAAVERELGVVAGEGIEGPYAAGEAITMADLYLVPQVYNARRFDIDLTPFPRIVAAETAALATDAAKASHPDAFKPA
jgi:maleylacetoacetate isomerase